MLRIQDWLTTRKESLVFLGAVLGSLILMFNSDVPQVQTVRVWALAGFGTVLDRFAAVQAWADLEEENRWLRRRNAELMLESSRLREAREENFRLRQMLDFKAESRLELIPGRVIGRGGHGFINSLLISVGTADGVTPNMPVVTAEGLVGKVFEASGNYATVQLLLDRNFKVSAVTQRGRVKGIVAWSEGNTVVLSAVPRRSDVRPGDRVVTSGYSALFPRGLRIGVVQAVDEEVGEMFMEVAVKPEVDFARLEEVFVIRGWPSEAQDDR